jgi:hypothetical protein
VLALGVAAVFAAGNLVSIRMPCLSSHLAWVGEAGADIKGCCYVQRGVPWAYQRAHATVYVEGKVEEDADHISIWYGTPGHSDVGFSWRNLIADIVCTALAFGAAAVTFFCYRPQIA